MDERKKVISSVQSKEKRQKKNDPHIDGKGPNIESDWRKQIKSEVIGLEENIKIVSWNVNGLRSLMKPSKISSKGIIYDYLEEEKPDILFLSETKLNKKVESDYISCFEQYVGYHQSSVKPGYAGVAFYLKKNFIGGLSELNYDVSDDKKLIVKKSTYVITSGMGITELDNEARILTLYLKNHILVGCYSMNAGQLLKRLDLKIKKFDPTIFSLLKTLHNRYKKEILCLGDLNCAKDEIDIWNSKANAKTSGHTKEERESLSNFLNENIFKDIWRSKNIHTRRYTFWPAKSSQMREKNLGWRIDLFIGTNDLNDQVTECSIRDWLPGSDHVPIILTLLKNYLL